MQMNGFIRVGASVLLAGSILTPLIFVATSCGKEEEEKVLVDELDPSCLRLNGSQGSYRRTIKVVDDGFSYALETFADVRCESRAETVVVNGRDAVSEFGVIENPVGNMIRTVYNGLIVQYHNATAQCGYTDWEIGTPKNFNSVLCTNPNAVP